MAEGTGPQGNNRATGTAWLVAWLAAAVGGPSAWAAFNQHELAAHPLLGIILAIVAAVAVLAGGLVATLWHTRYHNRVINWMGDGLDRRLAGFGGKYRARVLSDLRFVDLHGLVGRHFEPELDDVYVDVALVARDASKVPSSDLPAGTADPSSGRATTPIPASGQRHVLNELLRNPQPRVLAVIGAPGSGKTTLLRHTAREACQRTGRTRARRDAPILLYLREHAATIAANPQVSLPMLAAEVLVRYGLTEPTGWFDGQLRAGRCLVLLDGFDEVAVQSDRQAISDWVSAQVTRYPDNDFVVTSRPLGYQSAPIDGAITVQTQPFTPNQVRRFVHAWYLAENRQATATDDPTIVTKSREDADDLLSRLHDAPGLRPLTVNPLLLTMIAIVHRHHGALPGSRAELYAQICQVLLWRRQTAKKLAVEPGGEQKERLMRVLAYEMMLRKAADIPVGQAATILKPAVRRIVPGLPVEEFLSDAAASGFFVEREAGKLAFAHLTFQEYLAAAHIKDKNLLDRLANSVDDAWWRETILLYVAGADASPVVEACLSANTVPALALAFDCADEAGELAEGLRERLDALLATGLAPSAGPALRQLLVAVTLARHFRPAIETASGTQICRQLVTTGIYQFFLDDMAKAGIHCPPDVPSAHFTEPGNVVMGMRGSDAIEFAKWANAASGGTRHTVCPH